VVILDAGGLPDGSMIGAIGVSGVTSVPDGQVANVDVDAFRREIG